MVCFHFLHCFSLTRPTPSLKVSTIFILHVQIPSMDFIMELVAAFYFDMRVHNGHQLVIKLKISRE